MATEKNQQERRRSRAYPVIALGESLEKIEKINDNLGVSGQFNRESIASGMGYSSLNGSSSRRIAALVQYGLLDRERDLYFLSALAKKYLLPIGDNDKIEVIQEAALAPALFSDIYESLKGQVVPKQFINRLIQEFRIEQKVAPDVDKIFRSTMETAGILKSNGILNNEIVAQSPPTPVDATDIPSDIPTRTVPTQQDTTNVAPMDYLSVKLPSGLVVIYSQELASAFAFGTFGAELKALDDAVTIHLRSTDDAVATEEA